MNDKATNAAIVLIAITGITLAGAMAYNIINSNPQETEEIATPEYIPTENITFSVNKYHLEDHNLSVKLDVNQDDSEKLGLRCYAMVSELYRGNWTNISLETNRVNVTDGEIILENITKIPDGYHKIFFYLIYQNNEGETVGTEESFTIESVLGHERSWKVVDEWP
jgi:hypothetical protein